MKAELPNDIKTVLKTLHEKGYEAYIVGGCVRDTVMGITPHDYDITTSALPDEIAECFCACKTIETGKKHGTITVLTPNCGPVEITTYRVDGEYLDNRRPSEVKFVNNIKDDLSRRDFTVNALAFNENEGLLDCFFGIEDIKNHVIRAVGDPNTRFCEDALRILRALRFSSTLGFKIEKNTAESIVNNAHLLDNISVERIYAELKKLILGKNAYNVLTEYIEVFKIILPELFAQCSEQDYKKRCKVLSLTKEDVVTRLSVLLSECAKTTLSSLKSDNLTKNSAAELSANSELSFDNIKIVINKLGFEQTKRLADIKIARSIFDNNKDNAQKYEAVARKIEKIESRGECVFITDLAISGKDLLDNDICKGKAVGQMLDYVLNEVLFERLPNEKNVLIEAVKSKII